MFLPKGSDLRVWLQLDRAVPVSCFLHWGNAAGGTGTRLNSNLWSIRPDSEVAEARLGDRENDPKLIDVRFSKRRGILTFQLQHVGPSGRLRDPEFAMWLGTDRVYFPARLEHERDLLCWSPVPTPPAVGKPGRYTIAFGSCTHTGRFPSQPIWTAIAREKPDCFLWLGDNVYLPNRARKFPEDRAAVVKVYRDFYDRQMRVPELQPLLRSTMTFAIWDDHDYGPNNSDRTWKWKDVAFEVFQENFPGDYGLPDAAGCFHRFSWGDIDVFMLDDRTFRDPNKDPNRKTMFGDRQLAWLEDGLKKSKATFKVIANGNQMLSDGHRNESWGVQFRPERDAFLDWVWENRIGGVLFIAGDRHFAELVRKRDSKGRGPKLWELTSSPLANFHHAAAATIDNPHRVGIYTDGVNYGLLRFDTTARPPRVDLQVCDERGDVVISRTLRLPVAATTQPRRSGPSP